MLVRFLSSFHIKGKREGFGKKETDKGSRVEIYMELNLF